MVVPGSTIATAAQTNNTHTLTDATPGNGSRLSNGGGGFGTARASLRTVDPLVGNDRTPRSRPAAYTVGNDRVRGTRTVNGRPRAGEHDTTTTTQAQAAQHTSGTRIRNRCPAGPASDDPARAARTRADTNDTGSQNDHPVRRERREEKNARKTAITVASLNMNGFGNLVRDHQDNKWGRMYRMMTDNRIGVLLLQETHLTDERKACLHKMFAKRVKIFHSAHAAAPTQKEGVAVVLNSRYVNTAEASAEEIIPGRAIQVSLSCLGGNRRNILCIYAPTSAGITERSRFFEEIRTFYEARPSLPKPHLVAGDFNNIEDSIDRLPINESPDRSVIALDELKISLGLMVADGWRATYPTTREYSFHRGSGREATFSRLDRIYVTPGVFDSAREWKISESGVKTDHSLISVQLTEAQAPEIGPGRPVFPISLLKDKPLTRHIKAIGLEAISALNRLSQHNQRTETENPQTILHNFKLNMMREARKREREVVPKLLADIREREGALKRLKNAGIPADQGLIEEAAALTKQIRELKQRRYKQQMQNTRATHRLYGDRPTKYWSKLHKERAPREVIPAFERVGIVGVSGEKLYETDSAKMADMARLHHINIQRDDPDMSPEAVRETDITEALDSIDQEVSDEQALELGGEIRYEDCVLSLRFAKNGTAPGLDGIQFEVWKTLHARHIEDARYPSRPDFDVVCLLTAAFEDVRIHGVSKETSFAQGWMAPIYKEKGERTLVVNYRPITVLNTDYKLLSKTLAIRLASVAPMLIHRTQAGFVPGRKIHNHTQLARMMMTWAEVNNADGAIIALDQEKAYDKIDHAYLWRVLRKFGIPESMIKLIQSLYAHAETSVMINGTLSKVYRIYRGVRQGDPLSCLLFDLAIEPLSSMIRKSTIRGFDIPKCEEVLKAVLFADDTTVYLSAHDEFATLQKVLDTWCSAAKAKFNIGKTEIIPIGSEAFREEMASTYRDTGAWRDYPRNVHMAQNGEAVRILGAFFGNGVNQADVWTMVLTKIVAIRQPLMQVLARWKEGSATIQGKKHIVQMIVGGITQFLTNVQRMPENIVDRLNKIIRGILWNDRSNSPVALKHMFLPVELGGMGILDLKARSEAIDIMWLKAYLDFSAERPIWAFLADELLATYVTKDCMPKQRSLRLNPFLQKWKPKVNGIPPVLDGMMKVARKYGVRLEGLAFSRKILLAMPMWDHAHADRIRLSRLSRPSKLLTCLQANHNVVTVGDFVRLVDELNLPAHRPTKTCSCLGCERLKQRTHCENPHLCGSRAKDMISTLPYKWNPTYRHPEDFEDGVMEALRQDASAGEYIPFDRRVTTHGDLGHSLRIFTSLAQVSNEAIPMELDEDGALSIIAMDGSCLDNGEKNAAAGAGLFIEEGHELNLSFRLPNSITQSNQTAEISATLLAAKVVNIHTRTAQETDSQTTMDSLTKWRKRHEDTGFILQKNADLTRKTIAALRMRKAHTLFKWVKGHNGHARNEGADRLAAVGAAKPSGDELCLNVPPAFALSGAKLQAMTQKLAYRAIRARKDAVTKPRPRTAENLDRIYSGLKEAYGIQVHDTSIWKSLQSKHLTKSVSQFMWMAIHDGYMIGTHWTRPNMAEELKIRAICAICGECESMSHIILECKAKGQEIVWDLLKQTWALTGIDWKEPCWGSTFGAACIAIRSDNGSRKTALESLWCILCSEALHLIWKLRCERVIQNEGEDFSEDEITHRYYAAMNFRLTLDRRTAAFAPKGKKSLKPQEVERIWLPILENNTNLPPNWAVDGGVLVGIRRGR